MAGLRTTAARRVSDDFPGWGESLNDQSPEEQGPGDGVTTTFETVDGVRRLVVGAGDVREDEARP